MAEFTHFNNEGRAKMVDVSNKNITARSATAQSKILVTESIYQGINSGNMKKGDVLSVAQIAAIMAAKNTHQIIPMCHPLLLTGTDVNFKWEKGDEMPHALVIEATVTTKGQTGVEMEALNAASVAALTVYDMCKALDKGMIIKETKLLSKSGGKSDFNA